MYYFIKQITHVGLPAFYKNLSWPLFMTFAWSLSELDSFKRRDMFNDISSIVVDSNVRLNFKDCQTLLETTRDFCKVHDYKTDMHDKIYEKVMTSPD